MKKSARVSEKLVSPGLQVATRLKVIYRLAHKRRCVFRDVRIKTKVSA